MEGRLRNAVDGSERCFQTRAIPVGGEVVGWLSTSTNIDDLRRTREQHFLVADLQHRTGNLLGVVHSIAQQTLAASDTLEAFGSAFNERLAVLSSMSGFSRACEQPLMLQTPIRRELAASPRPILARCAIPPSAPTRWPGS